MVNFKSDNAGEWFYFDEDNQDAGGVCLRQLTADEIDSIERVTVKTTKKFKRGVAYDDVDTNKRLQDKLTWRYVIVDWKGISIDGNPVECNKENKDKVMKITDFVNFIAPCLETLTEQNKSLEEARVKNLPTSADGDSEE